jgi:hypothetical protein
MVTNDEYADALTILGELRKSSETLADLRGGEREWSAELLAAVERIRTSRDHRNRGRRAGRFSGRGATTVCF